MNPRSVAAHCQGVRQGFLQAAQIVAAQNRADVAAMRIESARKMFGEAGAWAVADAEKEARKDILATQVILTRTAQKWAEKASATLRRHEVLGPGGELALRLIRTARFAAGAIRVTGAATLGAVRAAWRGERQHA